MRALLAALWQSDAAFPSGGFAFSNGVEAAVAALPTFDRAALYALIGVALSRRWFSAERLATLHALHASNLARLREVDEAYEAATLCAPLRLGSRRNGRAFLTAHRRLDSPGAAAFESEVVAGRSPGHPAVAHGWIWRGLGLGAREAAAASAYTTASGMANAAVRLGALGALEAQAALAGLMPLIEELAAGPFDPADTIAFSSAAAWLDIVAAHHARAHLRLFAN